MHHKEMLSQAVSSQAREVAHKQADLYTRVDVAVQPIDLHACVAPDQETHKGTSEHSIAVEVPVIEEPDATSADQSMPEESDEQAEGLPVVPCTTAHNNIYNITCIISIISIHIYIYTYMQITSCQCM